VVIGQAFKGKNKRAAKEKTLIVYFFSKELTVGSGGIGARYVDGESKAKT
jgi:hypothetical protein